jgi:transposase
MARKHVPDCAGCQRLGQQLRDLQAQVASLQAQLAAARKNSTTSSKPPSSDIVKAAPPEATPDGEPRRAGGQPGHPKHERTLFPPEQIRATFDYRVEVCPDCGQPVRPTGFGPQIIQQVELREVPLDITAHRQYESFCPCCRKVCRGVLPPVVQKGGLLGPQLTAFVAYLKGACHASFSTVRKFLRDVIGLTISRGQLVKVVAKVTKALQQPYEELLDRLPLEEWLNVDETGHKNNKERFWTWCFRAELYTLFKISPSRGADVLLATLGTEFDGVLGCDFFSAYRRYMRECDVRLQFCLAHFIREVKYLTTLPDPLARAYGERLREALRHLFAVIHQRDQCTKADFKRRLEEARAQVLWQGTQDVPATKAAALLAARLQKHGESYFRFVTTPGVAPTNNLAEQAIRFVVIDRHITQGTRSATGQRWCERIWTVIATCGQQGCSVYEFLTAAVEHWFADEPGPSLLAAQPIA